MPPQACALTLLLLAGAAAAQAQTASRTYHLPYLVTGGGARAALVLTNPSAGAADVTIAATDLAGLPGQVTLQPGETRTLEADSSGERREGAARVTASRPIAVLAAAADTQLGPAPVLRWFVLPVDAGRRTTVALSNPADQAVSVRQVPFRAGTAAGQRAGRVVQL